MNPINDAWLEKLYRETFPLVAKTVAQWGGDLEAAKDIFHDALIIYLEKKSQQSLQIKVSEKAYLLGIARICWIRRFNQESRHEGLNESDDFSIPEDFYAVEKSTPAPLLSYLQFAGRKCLELLQAFYYDQRSMQEIADTFHYKTRHSATVQKHKCLEKIREQLKLSAVYEETFA